MEIEKFILEKIDSDDEIQIMDKILEENSTANKNDEIIQKKIILLV